MAEFFSSFFRVFGFGSGDRFIECWVGSAPEGLITEVGCKIGWNKIFSQSCGCFWMTGWFMMLFFLELCFFKFALSLEMMEALDEVRSCKVSKTATSD